MSYEEGISIQNQIRNNSEDVQKFLKDLSEWEKDMKKKEHELKLLQVSDVQVIPPIRNSLSRSKKRNRQKKNTKEPNTVKERISSYNYKAWEEFDVDSELKKMDEDKEEASSSESSDSEEKQLIQRNKQLALVKKDMGNEFFKKGNYDAAINAYTIGIEMDPENPLLTANRAMAFLKKEQFRAAENDCSSCLSMDSTYVKAYLRRGTARKALKKFDDAYSDFSKALELEPDNKQAQLELEKLGKENNFLKIDGLTSQDNPKSKEKPSKKTDNTILQKSNFLECGNSDTDESPIEKLCRLHPDAVVIPAEDEFVEIPLPISKTEESKRPIRENKPVLQKSEETLAKSNTEKLVKSSDSTNICNNEVHNDSLEKVITALEQKLPSVPSTSYQFLTDWEKISKYPELKYQYLRQFPPEKFPVLFKEYMEPEIFPEILNTLSCFFIDNGDDVVPYMEHLASVGRFTTMVMFMSDIEVKNLKTLLNHAEMSGYSSSEIEALSKLYQV
ncbi:RNA polymerase II-associated protein 3 [Caerostris darwini]|uniref:RNA polymerase II-associated protein 3 n=1 Tax=Caerostris darwini TaxID=1538125 RepID=A0AAV4VIT6_9ARAC|nr:RNA polymerase II-associated protein 3 [Caerostris darwini]